MPATIKDVARIAGVSIATVSKMINGGNVLEDNRIAIEQAIKKLNYRVNTIARGMKTRRSMTVGVLIPSLADYYGISVLAWIDRALFARGYSTIICDYSKTDPGGVRSKLELLMNKQVDGIIMQPIEVRSDDLDMIDPGQVPVVFIDVGVEGKDYDLVTIDNEDISFRITRFLLENGHRAIGLIGGEPWVRTSADRLSGYAHALEQANVPMNEELRYMVDISEASGYEGMSRLMALSSPPTAIFTAGHALTLGALTYLNETGRRIPEDISFIGFETRTIARIYHPKLTIGLQPIQEIGQTAADLLLDRMTGEYSGPARRIKLNGEIDPGASVMDISH